MTKKKLTEEQQKNIIAKGVPIVDKEYVVTDECYWISNAPEDYNPYDKTRKPHAVSIVDIDTGTVVLLKSGSIIKVIHMPS